MKSGSTKFLNTICLLLKMFNNPLSSSFCFQCLYKYFMKRCVNKNDMPSFHSKKFSL